MTPQLITGILTISGVVIGGFIGFISAYRIGKINYKREAGSKLRTAFAPELASVKLSANNANMNIEELLSSAFAKHATAVEEFSFHVKKRDLSSYYEAWHNYYEVGGSIRFFNYYIGENCRQLFEQRVNAILEFSKIK